jgi:hypothetical protein
MAMGIFEQLGWLTTRVKRLCCAIKVGAFQERTLDAATLEISGYNITEGGIYQFYGGTNTGFGVTVSAPTSVGQTMYIANASVDTITIVGPAYNGTSGSSMQSYGPILAGEIWQFISVQGTPVFDTGLVWVGVKLYPNIA